MIHYITKPASFQHHHSHYSYKMTGWKGLNQCLCPGRHAVNGIEHTTHHIEYHNEKESEGHSLHLRIGIGSNQQTESKHGNEVDNQGNIEHHQISNGNDPINKP